jgi:hypothetical protein
MGASFRRARRPLKIALKNFECHEHSCGRGVSSTVARCAPIPRTISQDRPRGTRALATIPRFRRASFLTIQLVVFQASVVVAPGLFRKMTCSWHKASVMCVLWFTHYRVLGMTLRLRKLLYYRQLPACPLRGPRSEHASISSIASENHVIAPLLRRGPAHERLTPSRR